MRRVTILRGETLAKVAQKYQVRLEDLEAYNNGVLTWLFGTFNESGEYDRAGSYGQFASVDVYLDGYSENFDPNFTHIDYDGPFCTFPRPQDEINGHGEPYYYHTKPAQAQGSEEPVAQGSAEEG